MRHQPPTTAQRVATRAAAGVAVAACGGGATNSSTASAPAAQTAGEQRATTASGPPCRCAFIASHVILGRFAFRRGKAIHARWRTRHWPPRPTLADTRKRDA